MFRKYPYTNFHDINLDWIISRIKDFEAMLKKMAQDIANLFEKVGEEVNKIINQYIKDGTLYVAMEYKPETEELNIILTESEGDNNG